MDCVGALFYNCIHQKLFFAICQFFAIAWISWSLVRKLTYSALRVKGNRMRVAQLLGIWIGSWWPLPQYVTTLQEGFPSSFANKMSTCFKYNQGKFNTSLSGAGLPTWLGSMAQTLAAVEEFQQLVDRQLSVHFKDILRCNNRSWLQITYRRSRDLTPFGGFTQISWHLWKMQNDRTRRRTPVSYTLRTWHFFRITELGFFLTTTYCKGTPSCKML